jgi:hypothetical protein
MKQNIRNTRVISHSRKTNLMNYEYLLCQAAIIRTSTIKDLGVFCDSKLHFHNHVDFMFSDCIRLLGLIHSIALIFSSLDCLYVLYFTLVVSKLEYAYAVWNCIMPTGVNSFENTQQKFVSVCFYRVFPHAS